MKIKVKDQIAETEKALCLLVSEEEVWFPKSKINRWIGNSIVIPEWLAMEKGVKFTAFTHIPDKIEPQYDQEPIDELRFDPVERG